MGEIPRQHPEESEEGAKILDITSRLPKGSTPENPLSVDSRPNPDEHPDSILKDVEANQAKANRDRIKLWVGIGTAAAVIGGPALAWLHNFSEIDPAQREKIETEAKNRQAQEVDREHFPRGSQMKFLIGDYLIHSDISKGGVNVRSGPGTNAPQAHTAGQDILVHNPAIVENRDQQPWLAFASEDRFPVGGGEYFVSATQDQGITDLANGNIYRYDPSAPNVVTMTVDKTYDVGTTAKDKDGKTEIVATAEKE